MILGAEYQGNTKLFLLVAILIQPIVTQTTKWNAKEHKANTNSFLLVGDLLYPNIKQHTKHNANDANDILGVFHCKTQIKIQSKMPRNAKKMFHWWGFSFSKI